MILMALVVVLALLNLVILAGVAGLAVWAWRRSRTDRNNHRALVREIARLRMAERNSAELGATLKEIRRRLADQTAADYLAGVRDRATDGRPPLRAVARDGQLG